MYIFLLVIAAIMGISFLAQWFANAPPREAKRLVFTIGILLLIALSILFMKFSGLILAAIALAFAGARRAYTLFTAYQYVKHIKNSHKASRQQQTQPVHERMDEKEAREILGVSNDASKAEIKSAYHELMRKNHPDQGGSDYFAKKLNAAKDVLLGK